MPTVEDAGNPRGGAPTPVTAGLLRIVDRRSDPPGRGAVNRERFIRRFKDDIKRAADEEFGKRSITDVGRGGRISIPGRGLAEPRLRHDEDSGNRDFVLPGNREYVPGDSISRPRRGAAQCAGHRVRARGFADSRLRECSGHRGLYPKIDA